MIRAFAAALLAGTVFTSPAWAAIDAADFGVSASSSDNAAALERAFAAGRGQEVILPSGTLRYSREVRADSVKIKGNGTVMAPSNPTNQRIYLTGDAPSISNVKFAFKEVQRSGRGVERAGVWVQNAKNFKVDNVIFDGAAYGTPTKRGVGGGNLFVKNSQGGTITNNTVKSALADSIHITGGSRDIDVKGNRIEGSSDDGIAVVAYGKDGSGDVRIDNNTIIGNRWGRNITAVGSDKVRITNNFIDGNAADGAGVYVASEPAYKTDAPKDILVQGNTIQNTGGPGKGHGQVMLYAGNGAISGVTIKDNEVRNSKRDDLAVVLSGPMNGVVMEGNAIDGQISERGSGAYNGEGNTTNDAAMANSAPVPSGGGAGGGSIEGGTDTGGGVMEESPAEVERARILNSAGDLRASCAGAQGLSNSIAAGGAISSIFSGGRATAPLQLAQIAQMVAQRICLTEQLAAQIKMLQGIDIRTIQDVLSATNRVRGILRQGDFLATAPAILKTMQDAYPTEFPPGTPYEEMEQQAIVWNERSRAALDTSTQIENSVLAEQQAALERAGTIEQAGRDSGGIRGAQLATNALLTEVMGALDNQIAVMTAHQRTVEAVQYREEAEKAAAKRDAEDFMKTLGTCRQCGSRSINVFGGGSSPAVSGRTANDVFGTGN